MDILSATYSVQYLHPICGKNEGLIHSFSTVFTPRECLNQGVGPVNWFRSAGLGVGDRHSLRLVQRQDLIVETQQNYHRCWITLREGSANVPQPQPTQ